MKKKINTKKLKLKMFPSGGYLDFMNGNKGFSPIQYYQDNNYFRTVLPENVESMSAEINKPSLLSNISDIGNKVNQGVQSISNMMNNFNFGSNTMDGLKNPSYLEKMDSVMAPLKKTYEANNPEIYNIVNNTEPLGDDIFMSSLGLGQKLFMNGGPVIKYDGGGDVRSLYNQAKIDIEKNFPQGAASSTIKSLTDAQTYQQQLNLLKHYEDILNGSNKPTSKKEVKSVYEEPVTLHSNDFVNSNLGDTMLPSLETKDLETSYNFNNFPKVSLNYKLPKVQEKVNQEIKKSPFEDETDVKRTNLEEIKRDLYFKLTSNPNNIFTPNLNYTELVGTTETDPYELKNYVQKRNENSIKNQLLDIREDAPESLKLLNTSFKNYVNDLQKKLDIDNQNSGEIQKMYNGTGNQPLSNLLNNNYGNTGSTRFGKGAYTNAVADDFLHTKLNNDRQKFEDDKVDWGFMNWAKEPVGAYLGMMSTVPIVGDITQDIVGDSFLTRQKGYQIGKGVGKVTAGATKIVGGVATGNIGMVGSGVGDVGSGVGGTMGNLNADSAMENYNKQGYISGKRLANDSQAFGNIMDIGSSLYGNISGGIGNIKSAGGFKNILGNMKFANGGDIFENPGQKVPIQAETYEGQPEQVVLPDNTIKSTNANTSHENMGDNTITDVLPEGSHIQSSRNKLKPAEIEAVLNQVNPDMTEDVMKKIDQVYKDKYGKRKNKEVAPSDISEYAKNKYQNKSTPNSFKTEDMKKNNKLDYIELSKQLNELLKVGAESNVMAKGGFVGKYAPGTPPEGIKKIDYSNIPVSSVDELMNYLKEFGVDPQSNLPNYKFGDLENTKKRYIDLASQVKDVELVNTLLNLKGNSASQFAELKKAAGKLQNYHKLNNPELSLDFTMDTKDTRTSIPTVIKYGKQLGLSDFEIKTLTSNKNVGYHNQPSSVQKILDKANTTLKGNTISDDIKKEFVDTRFVDNEAYYRMPEKYQFNFGDITDPNSANTKAYNHYMSNYYNQPFVQGNYQKNAYGKYSAPTAFVTQQVDDINEWKNTYNTENPLNPGTYTHPGSGSGIVSFKPVQNPSQPIVDNREKADNPTLNPTERINPTNIPMDKRMYSGLLEKQLGYGLQGNEAMFNAGMSQNPLYYMETPDTYIKSRINELPTNNILYNTERTAQNQNEFLRDNTSDWSTLAGNALNNAANMYNQIGDQLSAINEKNVGLYNTTQGLEQKLLEDNMTVRNRNLKEMQDMINFKKNLQGTKAVKDAEMYSSYYDKLNTNKQKEDNNKLAMLSLAATNPDSFKGEKGQQLYNTIMGTSGSYNNGLTGFFGTDLLGNSLSNITNRLFK